VKLVVKSGCAPAFEVELTVSKDVIGSEADAGAAEIPSTSRVAAAQIAERSGARWG
jgi:hypothetical protein